MLATRPLGGAPARGRGAAAGQALGAWPAACVTALLLGALGAATACDPASPPAPKRAPASSPSASGAPSPAPRAIRGWSPPAARPGRPALSWLTSLPPGSSVGALSLPGQPEQTLRAIAAQPCDQGWLLQGLLADQAKPGSPQTRSVLIPLAALGPAGAQPKVWSDQGRRYALTLTRLGRDALAGELHISAQDLAMTDAPDSPAQERWRFDGPLSAGAVDDGLGHLGCFHTGAFELHDRAGALHVGPASGLWDRQALYTALIWFSEGARLRLMLRMAKHALEQGAQIEVDLAQVFASPDAYDVRLMAELLDPEGDAWVQHPVEAGQLLARFERARHEGPLVITLRDVLAPEALRASLDGHERIPKLHARLGFASDVKGRLVPTVDLR